MATAGDVVEAALKRILVQAADAPLEADETTDALESLNRMMWSWEARNIRLGHTEVSSTSDAMTIPDGAIRGVIANLALEIAPDYGIEINPALAVQARDGMRSIRQLGRPSIGSVVPTGLPRGSGNYEYTFNEPLYGQTVTFVLSLSDNTEATEFSAIGATTQVGGFWNLETVKGLDADTRGNVTNSTPYDVQLSPKARILATGSGTYTLGIYKSGQSVATASGTLSATAAEISVSGSTTLQPGDVLTLKITADTAANDVVVINGQFEA